MKIPRGEDWRTYAECLNTDPELFFEATDPHESRRNRQAAKEICSRCDVVEQCLAFALRTEVDFGTFGGMDANQRRKMRRNAIGGGRFPKGQTVGSFLEPRTSASKRRYREANREETAERERLRYIKKAGTK